MSHHLEAEFTGISASDTLRACEYVMDHTSLLPPPRQSGLQRLGGAEVAKAVIEAAKRKGLIKGTAEARRTPEDAEHEQTCTLATLGGPEAIREAVRLCREQGLITEGKGKR